MNSMIGGELESGETCRQSRDGPIGLALLSQYSCSGNSFAEIRSPLRCISTECSNTSKTIPRRMLHATGVAKTVEKHLCSRRFV